MIALKKTFHIDDVDEYKIVTEECAGKNILQDMTSVAEFTEWPKFDHPNVLSLLGIFRQPEFNVLLTPLHHKSLYDILKEKKIKESFDLYKKYLVDTVTGLQYLHYFNICHLDLEAENIMITSDMTAVIEDFSYAYKSRNLVRRYGVRTYNRPPEAGNLSGHCPPVDGKSFDTRCFVMLCFNIMAGKFLQVKKNRRESWKKTFFLWHSSHLGVRHFQSWLIKTFLNSLSMTRILNFGLI